MSIISKAKNRSPLSRITAKILLVYLISLLSTSTGQSLLVHASTLTISQVATKHISTNQPNFSTNAKPANNIQILINNKPHTMKDPILLENGRVFLPVRNLGELLNINIDYLADSKTAIAQNSKAYLELPLGHNKAIKDRTLVLPIDTNNSNTRILSYVNRTYLPVRFISENLGYQISYGNNTVSITTDGSTPVLPSKPSKPTPQPKPQPSKPTASNKPPTYKGKKDFETSPDGNWTWVNSYNQWLKRDPTQEGGQIDMGTLKFEGPNGNWK